MNIFAAGAPAGADGHLRARCGQPDQLRPPGGGLRVAGTDRAGYHPRPQQLLLPRANTDDLQLFPWAGPLRPGAANQRQLGRHWRRARAVPHRRTGRAGRRHLVHRGAARSVGDRRVPRRPVRHELPAAGGADPDEPLARVPDHPPCPWPHRCRGGGVFMSTLAESIEQSWITPAEITSGTGRHRERRFDPSALPLGVIAAFQVIMAMREGYAKTAFEDEGLYVYVGHEMIAHLLHGFERPHVAGKLLLRRPGAVSRDGRSRGQFRWPGRRAVRQHDLRDCRNGQRLGYRPRALRTGSRSDRRCAVRGMRSGDLHQPSGDPRHDHARPCHCRDVARRSGRPPRRHDVGLGRLGTVGTGVLRQVRRNHLRATGLRGVRRRGVGPVPLADRAPGSGRFCAHPDADIRGARHRRAQPDSRHRADNPCAQLHGPAVDVGDAGLGVAMGRPLVPAGRDGWDRDRQPVARAAGWSLSRYWSPAPPASWSRSGCKSIWVIRSCSYCQ